MTLQWLTAISLKYDLLWRCDGEKYGRLAITNMRRRKKTFLMLQINKIMMNSFLCALEMKEKCKNNIVSRLSHILLESLFVASKFTQENSTQFIILRLWVIERRCHVRITYFVCTRLRERMKTKSWYNYEWRK